MTPAMQPSLMRRNRQPEIMDQPGLDRQRHRRALRGLARINGISATARHFWEEIEKLAGASGKREISVLDVACGGGDVAIALARIAGKRGARIKVAGCDLNPTALDYARQRAAERGAAVEFFRHDVLADDLPEHDAIVCSLFLHHLSDQNAGRCLDAFASAARSSVQVSDLIRSPVGYALAQIGCRLLSRSNVVHTDGPRSVEAAWTLAEARLLLDGTRLRGARIVRRFPERFHAVWRRP